jgi:hypothetical protein
MTFAECRSCGWTALLAATSAPLLSRDRLSSIACRPGAGCVHRDHQSVDNHTHAHSTAPDDADSNALPLEGLDGRQLETIQILTAEGSSKTICFDITSFFGEP